MIRFFSRRIALMAATLLVVSMAIFVAVEVLPGDVAYHILGQSATEQSLKAVREKYGLDRPAHIRYLDWIGSALRGDLGDSFTQEQSVVEIVKPRLFNSTLLVVFAFIMAVPTALIAGIWAGVRKDSIGDRLASTISLVGISLPEFVTGVLLIVIFASVLRVLPSSSILLPGTSVLTRPSILILPSLTATAIMFAYILRMTRANVIDVMQTNYIRTAVLKGLPMRRVIFRHVIPNAMIPTISIIALNVGWTFGGLIIVENIFAYPGLGSLLLVAITSRDIPLIQAMSLLMVVIYSISNLLADVGYYILNPRIRIW